MQSAQFIYMAILLGTIGMSAVCNPNARCVNAEMHSGVFPQLA